MKSFVLKKYAYLIFIKFLRGKKNRHYYSHFLQVNKVAYVAQVTHPRLGQKPRIDSRFS